MWIARGGIRCSGCRSVHVDADTLTTYDRSMENEWLPKVPLPPCLWFLPRGMGQTQQIVRPKRRRLTSAIEVLTD